MKGKFVLTLIICVFKLSLVVAQTSASFTVEGGVRTLELSVNELVKLRKAEVNGKDKDGKEHVYRGVMLSTILDSAGVTLGKNLRGGNLTRYVLAKATDGYEIIFSLAEIDPEFTDNVILLAYQVDGKSLAANEGPFRLVVPKDKKHARWIRQLSSIKIMFAKD